MKKLLTLIAMACVTLGAWADKKAVGTTLWGPSIECKVLDAEGNVAVTKIYPNSDGYTSIPYRFKDNDAEEYYTVQQLGEGGDTPIYGAGDNYSKIFDIVVAEGVAIVAQKAFEKVTTLKTIELPSTLTTLGSQAFNDCSALAAVNIPASVTTLGPNIFQSCTALTSITINSIASSFDSWAFAKIDGSDSQAFNSSTTIYAPYSIMKELKDVKLTGYSGNPTYKVFNVELNEGDDILSLLVDLQLSDNTITVNRTLHGGHWNTICLPFHMSWDNLEQAFGSGKWKLAKFKEYADGTMKFESAYAMDNCTPYLIMPTEDLTSISITYTDGWVNNTTSNLTQTPTTGYSMIGNLNGDSQTVPSGALFIANDKVYKSTGKSPMNAMSAYFTVPSTETARSFTFSVDDETTGIISIGMDGSVNVEENVYDLQGRRVAQPTHGMYIVNGRKVIK